jgi:hypothetical protein
MFGLLISIAIFHLLGAMATILLIGKERKPVTPVQALFTVTLSLVIAGSLVVTAYTS